MKLRATLTLSLLLLAAVTGKAENTLNVHGTLSDNGKPFPDGLVVLQRLKDEKCARLFATSDLTAKDVRKLESCTQDLPWVHTDAKGNYSYERLAPGWYNIRFLWLLSSPPQSKQELMCGGTDWIFSFHPEKDKTGKYNGYAQGRAFELRKSKEIDFDYEPKDYSGADCLNALSGARPQAGASNKVQVYYPGVKGVLELDPGPTAWQLEFRPQDNETWLTAMERPDTLYVTAFLQKVEFTATPETCRFARWRRVEKHLRDGKFKLVSVQYSSKDGMALVHDTVQNSHGEIVEHGDTHAYLGSRNLCAEVHISKEQFTPEDQKLFDEVLATVKLLPEQEHGAEAQPRAAVPHENH